MNLTGCVANNTWVGTRGSDESFAEKHKGSGELLATKGAPTLHGPEPKGATGQPKINMLNRKNTSTRL